MLISSAATTFTAQSGASPASQVPAVEAASVEPKSASQEGVKVALSPEGKALAAKHGSKNADIDSSNLPDGVKKILKVIREIQEKIQKKMEELDKVMRDQSLSDKERESKAQSIQGELAALTSQLSSSTNDLRRVENELKLSTEQKKVSNYLSMPKA